MIPDHVITFFIALVALWTLFRWGGLIMTLAALDQAFGEHWSYAIACIVIAAHIEVIKARIMASGRFYGYRGPWL
jgi:hypothetical protein